MWDSIEKIYCINLDRRTDRWEQVNEEFRKVRMDRKVVRISAIDMPDNPSRGNHLSQAQALRLAKEDGAKNCLIFEDDAEVIGDVLQYLPRCLLDLPEDWSILYLGANIERVCWEYTDRLARLGSALATHAYLVNSTMFDILIDLNEHCRGHNDVDMDVMIVPFYKCFVTRPLLFGQRVSYSDVMMKVMDSNAMFKERFEAHLQKERVSEIPTFVTFITPTLGRKTLSLTLDSIDKQTDWNWESIVVFDGKDPNYETDNEHFKIIRTPDRCGHAGRVRNAGLDYVDTTFTAFVDDDDTIHPDYVSALKTYARERPDIDIFVFTYKDLSNGNTIPNPYNSTFMYGNVGISFAIKTKFIREHELKFPIVDCEDWHFLEEATRLGATHYMTRDWKYDVSKRGIWEE